MKPATLIVLALAGCSAAPERPATHSIRGTVRYLGTRPKPKTYNFPGYPELPPGGIPREDLVLDGQGGVKNAVVYVAGLEGTAPPPETPVVLEVQGLRYDPHVLALQVGQELIVHNRDSGLHHVHFIPERNPVSMFGIPKDDPRRITFVQPEVGMRVQCGIHPWMRAYVAVLDHPFFAVTDEQGRFEIRDLPPGKVTVRVWHEKLQADDQQVDVRREAPVNFVGTPK